MALRNEVQWLIREWESQKDFLAYNEALFNIYEGDLLTYVLRDLASQLSPKSYEQVKHRVPPINVLKKIVDKLSQIYNNSPIRSVLNGTDTDKKLVSDLENILNMNSKMSSANEFFNMFKNTFVEPYLDQGVPKLRAVPSERFIVASKDQIDETMPTHYMKCVGVDPDMKEKTLLFHAFTAKEFIIFNVKGDVKDGLMADLGNPDGVNRYGALPGQYINRSLHNLMPKADTDTLAMTKLIPVLLSDCNFAVMFQSFSIIYGIDLDDENLQMSPNAFWRFKTSKDNPDAKPEVGVIKPEVDTDKVVSLIRTELSMWMETRNIKPGAMGDASVDNLSSGVAKMIDEADTSNDRQKQTKFFAPADAQLLMLIVNHMHPIWMEEPDYTFKNKFSSNKLQIQTKFPEQVPVHDPDKVIDMETKKLKERLTTRKRAILAINPDMTDEQADELLAEIAAESETPEVAEEEILENVG